MKKYFKFLGLAVFVLIISLLTFSPKPASAEWTKRVTGDTTRVWKYVASSADGNKLITAADAGYIYTSTDGGATWIQRTSAGSRKWSSVASSIDGTKLVAVVNPGYIYTSVDSGVTWVQRNYNYAWLSVASSADGNRLVAGTDMGHIYISTDSGATWIPQAINNYWSSVASSSDGMKLVATTLNRHIYTSIDGGAIWTEQFGSGLHRWGAVTSSSDGTKLAVATSGDSNSLNNKTFIYTSTDSGVTWTPRFINTTETIWNYIASSSDGTKLIASTGWDGKHVYISTNSGATWTQNINAGTRNFGSVSSSADGTKFTIVTIGFDYIYTSVDSGNTWVQRNFLPQDPIYWSSVASSADGNKLVITEAGMNYGQNDGYIYTSTDSGATWGIKNTNVPRNWGAVASSSDGIKLVAGSTLNGYTGDYIYNSIDSGNTWIKQIGSGAHHTWSDLSSSADGMKLAGLANGSIFTSSDGGVTWVNRVGPGNHSWRSISSSSDGSKIFAVVGNGYIYKSSDGGSTWVSLPAAGARNWSSIASSADGVKLVAGVSGGLIYTSIDGGSTWVTQNNSGVKDWKDIASSSDGTKLVGIADYLYISSDSGVTWSQQTSTGSNWISVASSADGSKLIALEYFGNIYTYIDSSLNVTSQPASQISVNSAFLNGNIISTGGNNPTIRGFQYGQTISYGIDVKETGSYGTGPFSKSISNLTCGGVYHFRAYATNTTSTSYGSDMTLTAGACGPVPTLTTQAATSITLVTATLKGTVTSSVSTGIQNPTMRGFQYGTTTNYGAYATENGTFYPGSYSKPILALTCGTLYHYQAYASNTAGYGYGNDMTFTTGACAINGVNTPTLTTQASTAITLTGATLNGKIETTGGINSTIRGFQYGTTTNYGTNTTETGSYAIGNYSKTILALTCGTNYHYRSYATNTTGSGYGNDMTFSTLACTPNGGTVPTVTSPNSTLITATTATLSANITSAGMPATLQSRGFYWGTSPNPTTGLQVAGTTLGSYSLAITGLAPNSLYYYFAFGHNATGDGYSSQGTFTTLAATGINTPTLTTQSASSITVNSAILNGTVVTNGGANPTIRGFQYGLMTSYGNDVTYATSLSNSNGLYSKPISSLSCATTYHYRAYATNSTGTGYGNDMTLMTGGCASDEVKITPTPSPTPVPAVTPSVNNIEIKKLDLSASALLSLGNEEKINKNFQINNQAYPILSHPEVKTLSKVLKIEMTNDDIINLQKYLNTHGYVVSTSGNGSPGSEINYFGVKTRRAVIDFQKANNLKADGKVGPETWFLMK